MRCIFVCMVYFCFCFASQLHIGPQTQGIVLLSYRRVGQRYIYIYPAVIMPERLRD